MWQWNWSSWDQEKLVTVGNYQYTVFWDADRSLVLGRRDLRNDSVCIVRFEQYKLKNNDRHRNTCLGVSVADGRIHLSWDHHNDPLRYTKSRLNVLKDPPAQLTIDDFEPIQSMLSDPAMERSITYPRFVTDSSGKLYFFYRIGASGNGENYWHRYDSDSGKWERLGKVFASRGVYQPWNDSKSRNAYFQDLLFDNKDRLHAVWTYRETSRTWASNHDLHYAYSDDFGLSWNNTTGMKIADLEQGDPIELNDNGIRVVDIPVYSWLMNAGPMNFDSENRPHIVTFKARKPQPAQSVEHGPTAELRNKLVFVHYWRDHNGKFQGGTPIPANSFGVWRGDIVFDQSDNLIYYYTTPAGMKYMTATAASKWADFAGPFPLTDQSITAPVRNSTKHDRYRWKKEGILSFTAHPESGGFAIIDLKVRLKSLNKE